MNKKARTALEKSIAHWERLAALTSVKAVEASDERPDASQCALCAVFAADGCDGCPVMARVDMHGCMLTPYEDAAIAFFGIADGMSTNAKEWRKASRAELAFLKSLREEKQ